MITVKQLAAVLSAAALVAGAVDGADLLRNGSFRELDDAGRPAGWRVADDGQCVGFDKQEGALRVDIAKAGENDGQIVQRLEGLSAGRAYVLSGRLRSTKPGIGYLQAKLHRGGREQQRLTAPQHSETEWRNAELTFSTGDADAVEVICRFRQRDDTLGQTVWFSNLQLREAKPPRLVRGEAVPTFESIVFRNVVATLGEERESTGSAFKMGGAALSPGLSFIAHNTIFGPGGGLRSVGYGKGPDRGAYVAMSRNNLFAGSGHQDLVNISTDPRNDFDYDLTSRGGVRLATGGETHAVTAAPTFVAAAQGDLRLAEGSAGIDQGCVLPGLNDGFAGRGPDMGAFESGQAGPNFPPRPHALSVVPLRVTAPAPLSVGKSSVTVQLVAPPSVGKSWRAEPNSPWLSCTPAQGATSGEPTPVRIEIAADGREKPRYRGAVTFRTDRGCVRTVLIDAGIPAARK